MSIVKVSPSFSVNDEETFGVAHKIDASKKYRAGALLHSEDDEIKLISYQRLE